MTTTKTTKTTRVNFFDADKKLALRTSEFFRVVLAKAEINTMYRNAVADINGKIEVLVGMLEEGTKLLTKEQIDARIEEYRVILQTLEDEKADLIAEQATFEYTKADKEFRKGVKTANSKAVVKVLARQWFKNYGLDITGTSFETKLMDSIGKKIDVKTLVTSDGKKALVWDSNNALKNLYATSFEEMVQAGTIKNADIPVLLREKYGKKATKKGGKKNA